MCWTKTKCSVLTTALLLAPSLVGCVHNANSPGAVYGVSSQQPEDIPVPKGMEYKTDPSLSHVRESGSYRYADLTYEGNIPVTQVATYLMASMPLRNYQLEAKSSPNPAEEQLTFRRGPYVLNCSIKRLEEPPVTRLVYKLRTNVKP